MATIHLHKLNCILNDEVDKDEVYLKFNGKKIWPEKGAYTRIDNSESFDLNVKVQHHEPHTPLVIELWDFDYLSLNDHLGSFHITLGNDTSGKFTTSMTLHEKNSTASYILHWEIIE